MLCFTVYKYMHSVSWGPIDKIVAQDSSECSGDELKPTSSEPNFSAFGWGGTSIEISTKVQEKTQDVFGFFVCLFAF